MKRRVAITGIGVVTPFGCDLEDLWRALLAGRTATRLVDAPDGGPRRVLGAPVDAFSPPDHIDAKSLRMMSPAVAFGVAAAGLAAASSGLAPGDVEPSRLGAFVGSRGHSSDRQDLMPAVTAAAAGGEFRLDTFAVEGLPLVNPMWLLKGLANNVLYFVSLRHNVQGANNNISMGGVAGTMAVGEAFRAVQHGLVDVAFAGGYDSALDVDRQDLFAQSGLVTNATDSATSSRPFDRRRDGFVPAEGAAFLVLETVAAARQRGAHIHAEVLGYGSSFATSRRGGFGTSARGVADALAGALADASLTVPDAVFALGLATQHSDAKETEGLKRAFGARAPTIPVPALKSMLGNSFAASGVIDAAVATRALADGALPPTINLTDPDPACDLDYVAGTTGRPAALGTIALSNANLAGAHAALILGRAE